jgi:predicted dehydrogenase
MKFPMPRRRFLRDTTLSGCGLLLLSSSRSVWGAPANDRLNLALIGVGGRGRWFVDTMPKAANVVAMCDVNEQRAGDAFEVVPKARKFHDFRRMLETMEKEIDGVIIATPDHTHAVAAAWALKMGKHVYCEKPLTHSIFEARYLRELALEQGVATQMGNQGTASEAFRRAVDWIQAGVIGEVLEVHAWNDSGGAGERFTPRETHSVPDSLKWDLWLGPAPGRGFHPEWLKWHAWRDFGTGQLGNWSVHTMNLAFKALNLDSLWQNGGPASEKIIEVQAEVSGRHHETFPKWEIVRFGFPARGEMPPVRIDWHNGRSSPEARRNLEDLLGRRLDWGDAGERKWRDHAGIILVGTKGKIHANGHNTEVTLPKQDFQEPERMLPRSRGHENEWLDACKGGLAALSNFNYGGPLTEFALLGNIATQVEGKLEFNPAAGTFAGHSAANQLLQREYRKGWTL